MSTSKSTSNEAPEKLPPDGSSGQQLEAARSPSSFLKILWLFSKSDISTFVVPDTAYGIQGALAGSLLTTNSSPNAWAILGRLPAVAFFIWTNVLVFELANQRTPESVIEDSYNKPWRPIPNGLITSAQTRRLNLAAIPLVFGVSWYMGVWKETALLFVLTWMYNDLKGGDEDFVVRNLIIGAAFGLYNEGALRIGAGPDVALNNTAFVWTTIVSVIIFSTMHVQDMQDQVGDAAKGRRSAPIVLGEDVARWTVAVPVVFWSVFCPIYWDINIGLFVLPVGLGLVVAIRELWLRRPEQDHTTWVMWAGWLSVLYLLPVLKSPAAVLGMFTGSS